MEVSTKLNEGPFIYNRRLSDALCLTIFDTNAQFVSVVLDDGRLLIEEAAVEETPEVVDLPEIFMTARSDEITNFFSKYKICFLWIRFLQYT